MAGFYNLDNKEVIRIKVKKCDGKMQPEYKKFSIDPQITSFEMLQGILARAFEIRSDFTVSYLALDSEGQAVYLSMLSDWDMDAAFQCAADPCLKLKVDLRPFEEELEEWDVIAPAEIPTHRISNLLDKNSILGSITGTISHGMRSTMSSMQRAMGLNKTEEIKPIKPPMSDMEFHNYLDSAGFMVKPNEFRLSIYQGGIEPSLRRVAWRHLLNIYPSNMSGKDRFDYMKRKELEYRNLRDEWRDKFKNNTATEEVKYVASMVKKDVLRTDRSHGFYAGNDENENTLALFHILVTYALTHPDVSYCQGMSDLASPLLVTQNDEAQAYVCFCALMTRLRENFTLDGTAIMTKFRHLSDLLAMYDPALYTHLLDNSASDMFFCYRWFLLELKREFPFTDALYFLEVMWATLPPAPPENELSLVDPDYSSRLLSSSPCSPTFSFQHAMYAKLLAMRRVGALQRAAHLAKPLLSPDSHASTNNNLSISSTNTPTNPANDNSVVSSFDTSPGDLEDRSNEFPEVENALTRSLQGKLDSIDQALQEENDNADYQRGNGNQSSNSDKKDSDVDEEEEQEEEDTNSFKDGFKHNHFGTIPSSDSSELENNTIVGEYDPRNSKKTTLHITKSSSSDSHSSDAAVPVEQSGGFHLSLSSNEIYEERGDERDSYERSTSPDSAITGMTESSENQIQFTLSLDSNTNNSSEVSNKEDANNQDHPREIYNQPDNTKRSNVEFVKSENLTSNQTNNTGESQGSGIFQSMKRLLASPKRKNSQNSSSLPQHRQDPKSPTHSSKKTEGLSGRYTPSAPSLTALKDNSRISGGELPKTMSESHISDCNEATESLENSSSNPGDKTASRLPVRDPSKLPPPQEFGSGNPFLMFACLTLLLQHRENIMRGSLCYEEIAMHFDRLVRRHNADRVLHHARQLYTNYLRAQQANMEKQKEDEAEFGMSC